MAGTRHGLGSSLSRGRDLIFVRNREERFLSAYLGTRSSGSVGWELPGWLPGHLLQRGKKWLWWAMGGVKEPGFINLLHPASVGLQRQAILCNRLGLVLQRERFPMDPAPPLARRRGRVPRRDANDGSEWTRWW